MSEVERLRAQLHDIGGEAKQQAKRTSQFSQRFSKDAAAVDQLIRHTATGEDREIATLLRHASTSVGQAVDALRGAADRCAQCASEL